MIVSRLAARLALTFSAALLLVMTAALGVSAIALPLDAVTFITRSGPARLYAYDLRREFRVLVAGTPRREVISYRWSPDGRSLAIIQLNRVTRRRSLWIRRPAGPPLLVENLNTSNGPYWTPDSRAIVQFYDDELALLDIATGETRFVPLPELRGLAPNIYIPLPSGDVLIQARSALTEPLAYFRVDLATEAAIPAEGVPCDGNPREYALSPTHAGTYAFSCFNDEILLYVDETAPDPSPQVVAPLSEVGGLGREFAPRWSSDGEKLLFTYLPTFVRPGEPDVYIYSVSPRIGTLAEITSARDSRSAAWLPPLK